MSTETPLLTQGMVNELGWEIEEFGRVAARAQGERDRADSVLQDALAQVRDATLIRAYMQPRVGRSLAEITEEVREELAQAEADHAKAATRADAAREHLRDLEGYQRIMEQQARAAAGQS